MTLDDPDQALLHRIRALLAKAESTQFPEEAEALTAKAQQLMARHSIEQAMLTGRRAGEPGSVEITIPRPYVRPKATLLGAVARANRCQGVLHGDAVMVVFGFEPDLRATELVFTSLLVQADRAMLAHGRQVDHRGRSRTRSFRQAFLLGFAQRAGERLRAAARAATADAERRHGPDLLPVIASRSAAVDAAAARHYPHTTRLRTSATNGAGYVAGVDAAERADLGTSRRLAS